MKDLLCKSKPQITIIFSACHHPKLQECLHGPRNCIEQRCVIISLVITTRQSKANLQWTKWVELKSENVLSIPQSMIKRINNQRLFFCSTIILLPQENKSDFHKSLKTIIDSPKHEPAIYQPEIASVNLRLFQFLFHN